MRHSEHKVDGEKVIGIRAAVVNPHLVHHRAQHGGCHEHVASNEGLQSGVTSINGDHKSFEKNMRYK